ncbi:porin family protein [Elizabethkingia anophelis]|uniref:Outer membrane protein beta-barrel domain-containing protein n=1 Tax=Elizabethkingia anophelis TaxID=1117645 RepID=A0AAU8UU98_9FLAO|nr:porin family protein [Elizabethkingia anophelis]AQW99973.1 hypothetical protein BBD32_00120 [Elizabethkingia anophelis]MCL1034281.1 PorT family protein [Elizabethkingia anophelis]MCT3663629.1 PorT family protein [Elizabethkingia anophelis]MCT3698562.1 PorT family protein [Elizabethkingia anophelis]MCT3759138.1 PorT family protein [Elizabethkingia anophelis]
MKQRILGLTVLLACITCSVEVSAQQQPSIFHLGVKGGGNFTKVSTSSGLTGKYDYGYHLGAMARVDLGSLYVQGEALYNQKRTSYDTSNEGSQKLKWNSIDIPVVVGYKIINDKDYNVRIFAGGVYSYAFSDNLSASKALQESFKKFDKSNIGITGGIGLDYKNFTIDLRYETGLSNVSKEFKSKPHSFSLGIGYFLF